MSINIAGRVNDIEELRNKITENLEIGTIYLLEKEVFCFDGEKFYHIGYVGLPSEKNIFQSTPFELDD